MKIEFEVKLTTDDLYRFLMSHIYSGFQGWLSIFLGLAVIALSVWRFQELTLANAILYFAVGVIFIVYTPLSLRMRAKKQILLNPAMKETLRYVVDEEGVQTILGEEQTKMPWENVYKVVGNKHQILIYTTRINAAILPRIAIGPQCPQLEALLREKVEPYKLKLKKV